MQSLDRQIRQSSTHNKLTLQLWSVVVQGASAGVQHVGKRVVTDPNVIALHGAWHEVCHNVGLRHT